MAFKDTLTYRGGSATASRPCVNVRFKVGIGGDNGQADVMLIQTMFHYFGHYKGKANPRIGFPLGQIPAITGICDDKTKRAILSFQRANRQSLLKIDGLIEPADYSGRVINYGVSKRVMTITLLDQFVYEEALMRGEPDHIAALIKVLPQLRAWLN